MSVQVVSMPAAEAFGERLAQRLGVLHGRLESRRFPDGEIYLRMTDEVIGRHVAVVAQLRDPDPQLPGLFFLADALRELGAASVGLVAPYLPYMRQDTRFRPGEAITSLSFARLVSGAFSWLVTVDPHLHRYATLDTIYRLRTATVSSAPAIADWVRSQVPHPHIVGPDEESTPWVSGVAAAVGCSYSVLRKHRSGDHSVELTLPDMHAGQGRTPVLVDDIISSGQTLATTVRRLRALGLAAPVCIGVHAIFAGDADAALHAAGAGRVVSCNTLPHASNAIDVTAGLADAVRAMIDAGSSRAARA
jgi:ribose-phosphate pyrophosphokinase